jgi:hypothetical protein
MTDSEAAGLLGVAYTALNSLPDERWTVGLHDARRWVLLEAARLRNQSPEDVQREFEK